MNWIQTPEGFRRVRAIALSDRGYRYGMAVFETLRVDGGHVRFLDEHLASLRHACGASDFPKLDLTSAAEFLKDAVVSRRTGVARIHVTAGDGGPGDAVRDCRVILDFEPREAKCPLAFHIRIDHAAQPAAILKSHNYWRNASALLAARSAGADETLLFDPDGRLISAAMANVFVVNADGAVLTPERARAGILRAWVAGRRKVAMTTLNRETLRHAKEVFLTNSWFGITPVASLDGKKLPSQKVAAGLRSELQAYYDGTVQ